MELANNIKSIENKPYPRVAAVVVTYNRKDLLQKCIEHIKNQTFSDVDIILIDNASTDGTESAIKELRDPKLFYYNTGSNLGGAGGFSYGIKKALDNNYDYCWIMDDDTFPEEKSLKSLIEKITAIDAAYICSRVIWTDGTACLMNTPPTGKRGCLHDEKALNLHLIGIEGCSFVSCLVDMKIVKLAGLPIAEFFIYGDDVEFTRRLEKFSNGYIDLDSVVTHAMKSNGMVGLALCPEDRISRYKFGVRNNIYINRMHDHMGILRLIVNYFRAIGSILRHSKDHKIKRIYTQTSGFISGLFFNPPIAF